MIARIVSVAMTLVAWTVFLVAIVWPVVALVLDTLVTAESPEGGFAISQRQWGLLWRSCYLAAGATVASTILSIPAAFVVGGRSGFARRPWLTAFLFATLMLPPTVSALAWERLLPLGLSAGARCIWVWAAWSWPIGAIIIGSGWSRVGRLAYEAALLTTSAPSAFARAVIPTLRSHLTLTGLILFLLFLTDYGVPHTCGLLVYSTELLGWAANSRRAIDTLWPSIPMVSVAVLAVVALLRTWRGCASASDSDGRRTGTSGLLTGLAILVFVVSWAVPVGALIVRVEKTSVIKETINTYAHDVVWSVVVAVVSGVLGVVMGLGFAGGRRTRTWVVAGSLIVGALPGALIGDAFIAAFNRSGLVWVYDSWLIVALCHTARFSWIGVLAAMLATRNLGSDVAAQARVDGASEPALIYGLMTAMGRGLLIASVGVTTILALGEAAATALVRVPTFSPLSQILIEKFHRFEDGTLVSLCLLTIAASVPVVLALSAASRRL